MTNRIAVALVVLCVVSPAAAQDAGVCTPNRDRALGLMRVGDKLMHTVDASVAEMKKLDTPRATIATIANAASTLQCDEAAVSGKELADLKAFEARAAKWAAAEPAVLDREEQARANIIVPLCQAIWTRDNARAELAREKSNPSGVVDLRELHAAGGAIQDAEANIAALRPQYAAYRHHAFTDWHAEGACVADSATP